MKNLFMFFLLAILSLMAGKISYAQSPDKFNYQAVYRDASGNPVANTAVNVDIYIRLNAVDGTVVYEEGHNPTTNKYGLINIIIGDGDAVQNLGDLDWSAGTYFMQVSINGTELSNTQLLSVPYSKYAGMAGNGVSTAQT
ncbi:MAG: hypothetical protein PF495_06410, partial [Spirochaetales bacterium]|nr:hypothetical protein [Spirochaetales bacterium]